MFSKLIVVFCFAILLGNSIPVPVSLYQTLVHNDRFIEYYTNYADATFREDDDGFAKYLGRTVENFKNWSVKIQDPTSKEYGLLVALQNGNTYITANQEELLNKYVETLYQQQIEKTQSSQVNIGQSNLQKTLVNTETISAASSSHQSETSSKSEIKSSSQVNINQNTLVSGSHNSHASFSSSEVSETSAQNSKKNTQYEVASTNEDVHNTNQVVSGVDSSLESAFSSSKHDVFQSAGTSSETTQNVVASQNELFGANSFNIDSQRDTNQAISNINQDLIQDGEIVNARNGHVADDLYVSNRDNTNQNINQVHSAMDKSLQSFINDYGRSSHNHFEIHHETPEEQRLAKIQSKNSHYFFDTVVDDNIQGNYQQREEVRKDGRVYGKYEYDDGNNYVTRYYVADDNGFRIYKATSLPSRKKGRPNGDATVHIRSDNGNIAYHINAGDIHNCNNGVQHQVPHEGVYVH